MKFRLPSHVWGLVVIRWSCHVCLLRTIVSARSGSVLLTALYYAYEGLGKAEASALA